ncbi:hypothetical protein NA56DRAFT_709824 [Hyaloscypha hepaticicola]|uniref:Uncharacterized protein n=1 Tax=Hyaloscypha hepaticicola TaxID=2082293 RepID=A0A2J6PN07_9HELO|nr:hypothetical protein NA56DRAFT_709824 [Hyaloscypha hepaticicola]
MHFRSLIVGAFLLFMGLYVSASPIPEAAFESYIKIKGAKDSRNPEKISVRMRRSWLDGALKVRVNVEAWESLGSSEMHGRYCEASLWRPLLRRAYPLKRVDDRNTPGGEVH